MMRMATDTTSSHESTRSYQAVNRRQAARGADGEVSGGEVIWLSSVQKIGPAGHRPRRPGPVRAAS